MSKSKLVDIDECFFPEIMQYIYSEVKRKGTPLQAIDKKYGVRLCRLMSRKQMQYEFVAWIEFGGEALLIEAAERHGTKRKVAIKLASPEFNAPGETIIFHGATVKETEVRQRNTFRERFIRGMEHQQTLTDAVSFTHGSIPAVYEVSKKPLYFVMQFISGTPYDTWVMRTDLAERLTVFEKILRFFVELHQHGYMHRDLKPNNIMVRQGKPHLIDMTTCRTLEDEDDITVCRMGIGCRGYAAPEVLVDIRHADWRSDIYSLGRILEFTYTQKFPGDGQELPSLLYEVYTSATQIEKSKRYRMTSEMVAAYVQATKRLHIVRHDDIDLHEVFKGFKYRTIAINIYRAIVEIAKSTKE